MIDYNALKEDLLLTYQDQLCAESMAEIQAATDLHALIAVLFANMVHVTFHPFPKTDWVRKWFANDKDTLNSYGIYLDQPIALNDPEQQHIICYGDCNLLVVLTQPKRTEFLLLDHTQASFCVYGRAMARVHKSPTATAVANHTEYEHSSLNIRDIE